MRQFSPALLIAVTMVGLTVPHPASASPAGPELFANQCSACHGSKGEGNPEMGAPAIAGLDRDYLERQIQHFLGGARKPPASNTAAAGMIDILRGLSIEDRAAAAGYASNLPVPTLPISGRASQLRARNLVSPCMSCHGGNLQGTRELSAPRLTAQHPDYLKEQIAAFRSGRRGADPSDAYGTQMRAMALDIRSEQDVDIIVDYIRALDR